MKTTRRVAHLILKNTVLVGGIETFVTNAFLAPHGSGEYRHSAYCLRDGGGSHAGTYDFRPPRWWGWLPDAAGKVVLTPWALWCARRQSTAIVHFHGFGASLWAPLAKALGAKVVSHSHGVEWQRARWKGPMQLLLYAIAWITCRFSDRVLVVSRKEAETYAARFGVDCTVVPGGFEALTADVDLRAREKLVVVAGRPVPEKRILELVQAWNSMPDHGGHTLRVYCSGTYRNGVLERIQAACRSRKDVELSPFVSREEFVRALARSSYFVALSSLEGRSLAIVEALAMGDALVVANTPENREFVPSGGNHFLPPDASPADIATALEEVLRGPPPPPDVRQANARAGRSRSWADVRRECEQVYASL